MKIVCYERLFLYKITLNSISMGVHRKDKKDENLNLVKTISMKHFSMIYIHLF